VLYLSRLGPYSQILDKYAKKLARISDEEKKKFYNIDTRVLSTLTIRYNSYETLWSHSSSFGCSKLVGFTFQT
jgi:hypothetical protein